MRRNNYVYCHVVPHTSEIVYVGHGTNERAWRCTTSGGEKHYGHRSPEHADWCQDLIDCGYTPDEWVRILHKRLTKSEACLREQEEIRRHKPLFTRPLGEKLLKVKGDVLVKAKELRASGLFYSQIAQELGISTMSIWRALNGRTKNV